MGWTKLGSSECLNENPVDPQAGASSGAAGAAGGAAASGAVSLSAASLSAVGDAAMHDSKGTGKRALGEEPEAAATAAAVAAVAAEEEEEEEEEGQATTSAVDPAPSRELPAQVLNSTLYSNSMQYAVDMSQYTVLQSNYTRV
jgi:hypothetical protein